MKKLMSFLCSLSLVAMVFGQSRYQFIENQGQWEGDFNYRLDIPGGAMFLENQGITYHFVDYSELRELHAHNVQHSQDVVVKGHVLKIQFVGSNKEPQIATSDVQPNYVNYYRGSDRSKWVTHLYPVGDVVYQDVWPGIDVRYYNAGGRLKYEFIVNPGAKYEDIVLEYAGAESMKVGDGGELLVKTSLGEITEQTPVTYQEVNSERLNINCAFKLKGNKLGFDILDSYNTSLPLIIDPTLIFSTYTGSSSDNFGMTATYGSGGELYAGGMAYGPGYPTTVGAYLTTAIAAAGSGMTDVAITKFSSDGSTLIYSTYFGGGTATTGIETVHSMIEDPQGNLCVYGATSSDNFPTSIGAYDSTFNGGVPVYFTSNGTNFDIGADIYVTKFNSTGDALIGSTYIGGSHNDGMNANINPNLYDSLMRNYGDQFRGEIVVDSLSNVYVVSSTQSDDFPMVNAYQGVFGGRQDAIVFKFNPTLDSLIFSTYIGGINQDAGCGMKLDNEHNIYFTGGTISDDFPTTSGAYDTTFNGGKGDAYIAHLSADGSTLFNSTLIGTDQYDQSFFLERDAYGDIYIYGQTENPAAFPVINATYANANSGQFVMNIDSTLSNVIYASKFGNDDGGLNISPTAFRVDICGNVYISGWGGDILTGPALTGMPVSPDAYDSSSGDGYNFYIAVFTTYFESLHYGSYFGGGTSREHVDGGTSRFSDDGYIYQSVCAGCGGNSDFPTTPGAWSATNNSTNCNNGVFKMYFPLPAVSANITAPPSICKDRIINFTSGITGANFIEWDFGDGNNSSLVNPSHQYSTPGTYQVQLVVIDTSFITCVSFDTAYATVIVVDGDTTYSLPDVTLCEGGSEQIGMIPEIDHTYLWNPTTFLTSSTISNPIANPPVTTNYTLYSMDSVCTDTINQAVIVTPPPTPGFTFESFVKCNGVSLVFTDNSTNADSVFYFLNGVPLPFGTDSVQLDWSSDYTITQLVVNGECRDSMSLFFQSGNFQDLFQIDMPNVFTPFVTNGENDLFCPKGLNGEYCYRMHIYNRWGTEIWESSADEPCWDGLHKDTDAKAVDGVYYYVIEWEGEDKAGFLHLISDI